MNPTQSKPRAFPAGFVAYAPMRRAPLSYTALIQKYGREAFSRACAESKHSPLSPQEILERDSQKKTAQPVAT